ncbi:MAG: NAD-dependent epimerase/dehydratase family protein [Janthinobacterium lividum]
MSQIVALTGATGFIGRRILRALVARGIAVRALTRQPSAELAGVTWVRGSLEDEAALNSLVSGTSAVIHCAGQVRGRSRAAFQACNVDGTQRLVQAASTTNCARFLLFSSLAARHPRLSWYAESKLAAEAVALRTAGEMPVSIFRPTAVYGPGDRELRPVLAGLLRGWLPRLGSADARLSFVHVDDLVQATLCWLEADAVYTERYEINDGAMEGYGWPQLAALGARIRGAPVRLISVPTTLLWRLSRLNLALHRLVGREPMLTPSKVNELVHPDWSSSNRDISRDLGWYPAIELERALRERSF